MADAKERNWDLIVKVVGLVALIVSGIWTIVKFDVDRNEDVTNQGRIWLRDEATKRQELNSFIFQKQAALYFEASKSAATIATSHDKKAITDATDQFNELYWGELVVVEDHRVRQAMTEFLHCMQEGGKGCDRFKRFDGNGSLIQEINGQEKLDLPTLSRQLSSCIRNSLAVGRNIDFGSLSDPKYYCPYD